MSTLVYPASLVAGAPENVNDLNSNLNAISTVINGGLDNANIAASAGIVDTKLASPNNAVYRTVLAGPLYIQAGKTVGTYVPDTDGGLVSASSQILYSGPAIINIASSSYAVAGKTTYMRLRVNMATNATSLSTSVVKTGLYPISSCGGATSTVITATLGTVVSGSQVTHGASWSSGATGDVSSDFALPSNGPYMVGVDVATATVPTNHASAGSWQIEVRHA